MIDGLLTLTKGETFWMAVFFGVCMAAHFVVSGLTGAPEPIFALFAALILLWFVVAAVYTTGKWILHKLRPRAK